MKEKFQCTSEKLRPYRSQAQVSSCLAAANSFCSRGILSLARKRYLKLILRYDTSLFNLTFDYWLQYGHL